MSKISLKHSGGNVVSLNSPTSAPTSADVAFNLPNADGSAGQFMKTDGSGNLSFDAAGGGAVKQVKKTVVTALESYTLTSGSGFTGSHDSSLTVTITPESASNIIYVSAFAFGEGNTADHSRFSTRLKKVVSGGSTTYIPAAVGNRNPQFSKMGTSNVNASNSADSFGIPNYPDTAGTTSAITYTLQFMFDGGLSSSATYYLNRVVSDSDSTGYPNFVSWIVAMEVAP